MFMTCYLTCHSLWLATEAVAVAKGVTTVAQSYLHFAMAIGSESSLVVIICWTVCCSTTHMSPTCASCFQSVLTLIHSYE